MFDNPLLNHRIRIYLQTVLLVKINATDPISKTGVIGYGSLTLVSRLAEVCMVADPSHDVKFAKL